MTRGPVRARVEARRRRAPWRAWTWPVTAPGRGDRRVAIDRRPSCRVETGGPGVEIESKDALRKAAGGTLSELAPSRAHASPCTSSAPSASRGACA